MFLNLVRHLHCRRSNVWLNFLKKPIQDFNKVNKLRNLHSSYPKANEGYSIEHEFSDGQPLDIDIVSDSIMETTTVMNGKTSNDNLVVANSPGGTSWQDSNPQFLQLYSPKIIIDPEDTIKSTLEGGGVEQGLGKPRSGFPISLEIPTTWKYQQSGSPNDSAETEIDSLSPTSHHDDAGDPEQPLDFSVHNSTPCVNCTQAIDVNGLSPTTLDIPTHEKSENAGTDLGSHMITPVKALKRLKVFEGYDG